MALKKVEICGVNTSKLPVLSEEEKKNFSKNCKKAIWWQEPNIFMAI